MTPWRILGLLFFARFTMGLQFQSFAAAGPGLVDAGMDHATLGTLIGLYLLPGVAVSIPGGWLGQRFGDKRLVVLGLALMTLGGLATAALSGTPGGSVGLMLSRIVAGTGAVLLNVLVTKMAADWFVGRATATAMGILITSWPVGLALALVVLPPVAALSVPLALALPSVLALMAMVLVAALYQRPPGPAPTAPVTARGPGALPQGWRLALLAGLIWGLYNCGLILLLSFGADLLVAQGMAQASAAAAVSLAGWLILPGLMAGGWIGSRVPRPDLFLGLCLAACGAGLALLTIVPAGPLALALLGVVFSPAGALIMALPARALALQDRSLGFGLYFAVYYAAMAVAPVLAGTLRDTTGSVAAPIWLAAACLSMAVAALVLFLVRVKVAAHLQPATPGV